MTRIWRLANLLSITLLCLLIASTASHAAASKSGDGRIERADFASYIDGYIAGIQRDWNIPGMVFIAVSNGDVLYKRGYGRMSNAESGDISPDSTLLKIGEISSLFTAVAVLQLAEKGRVSLDEDVNVYLRRNRLHDVFTGSPVTVRNLLTHTAGFDHKALETGASSAAEERNFANRLLRIMPMRFAPPGVFFGRSTVGYALLGSIVERYSRQSFASAIKRHIFTPLNMTSSTFGPTDDEITKASLGYDISGRPVEREYHTDLPAVGMYTTAEDMGRFMRAAMGGGAIGRGRMLSETYANSMLRTHFSPDPHIDGAAIGYMERRVLGVRTLQAYGNTRGCSSFLMLIPDKKFGIFFASNVSGLDLSSDISKAIIARFFGGTDRPVDVAASNGMIPDDILGSYRSNRISRSTAEKVLSMFYDQITVDRDGGGIVLSHTDSEERPPMRYLPVNGSGQDGARLFVAEDKSVREEERYIFFQTLDGECVSLVIGNVGSTYDKLDALDTHSTQTILRLAFIATAVISAVGLFFSYAVNRDKLPWEKTSRSATELWTISTLFCAIQISFILGIWAAYGLIGSSFTVFVPYHVKALFVIPLAGGLLLAWAWFRLVVGYLFNPNYYLAEKAVIAIVISSELAYMFFLFHWKLLGFTF